MKTKIYLFGAICTALISLFVAGTKAGDAWAATEGDPARESVSGTLELMGQITAVEHDKIRVDVEGRGEVLLYLDAATVVHIADSPHSAGDSGADCVVEERSGKREDLAAGRWIRVSAIMRGSAYQALAITLLSGGIDLDGQVLVSGTVQSVDLTKKTFSITTYTKEVLTIRLDPVVHHAGTAVDLTAIQVGVVVTINGKWRGDGSLAAVNIFPIAVSLETEAEAAHVDAEVQAEAQVAVSADPKDCDCYRDEDELLGVDVGARTDLGAEADVEVETRGFLEILSDHAESIFIGLGD